MDDTGNRLGSVKKKIHRLTDGALAVGMGWVMVMMMLTTLDVSSRYFFSRPVPGAIELSEFMLAIFGILGMAYTQREGGNVRVTMLLDKLPVRLAALVDTLTHILGLAVILLLTWQSWIMGIEEYQAGTTTDTLGIPIYGLLFLLSTGSFLLGLEMMITLWDSISRLRKRRPDAIH